VGKKTQQQQQKSSVSLAKVLDLLLWWPILILVLGILGYVGKGAAPLVRQLGGEMVEGFFSSAFLGLMGHLLQAGTLRWSQQMAGL
jgi:hypothetical protein